MHVRFFVEGESGKGKNSVVLKLRQSVYLSGCRVTNPLYTIIKRVHQQHITNDNNIGSVAHCSVVFFSVFFPCLMEWNMFENVIAFLSILEMWRWWWCLWHVALNPFSSTTGKYVMVVRGGSNGKVTTLKT